MKNEPCVRLGIFMRPKMSEKPADRRNSKPPSVMLFTASTSHKFISFWFERRLCRRNPYLGGGREGAAEAPSRLERWVVARVHGLRQEPLLVVRPELAHLRIRLDRGVDELAALLLAAADIEVPDDVAEVGEGKWPAWRLREGHRTQRAVERLAVVGLAARLLERRLGHQTVDVEPGGIDPGDVAVVAHHPVDEALVARRVEVGRVERDRDHP